MVSFCGEDLDWDLEKCQKSEQSLPLPGSHLCDIFYLGRVDYYTLSAVYSADPAEKVEVFSDLFGRLLFQLYYTIGKWRAADADGISEKRKDSDLGILRSTDDRNHYLQTGTGAAWIICTVLSAADHRYYMQNVMPVWDAKLWLNVFCGDIYVLLRPSSAADATDSGKRT